VGVAARIRLRVDKAEKRQQEESFGHEGLVWDLVSRVATCSMVFISI
jgi:hypothetical protein